MLTAYNLTSTSVRRSVSITSAEMLLGQAPEVIGAPWAMADGVLTIDLVLPPLSPLVVKIDTALASPHQHIDLGPADVGAR